MKRKKKHQKLIDDYETQKRKHIEKLSNKMLENDEKLRKFKSKEINNNFLDLF
jgi:hypothetical protein